MIISKRDVAWTYLSRILTLGINLILLPLVMKYLSDIELGLWYVFSSIYQIVCLFDFGFNTTISRHMTYAWSGAEKLEKESVSTTFNSEPNEKLMASIIKTCKVVYFLLSASALIVMLTIGTLYVYKVVGNEITSNIVYAWIVYTIAVFFNLYYGYWTSLLQGIGAVEERYKMGVYSKTVQIVLAFILLLLGTGLLGYVIAYLLSGISLRLLGKRYFYLKTFHLSLGQKGSIGEVKECFLAMWSTAWRDGFVMMAQYFSTQANTLICAYYIDLASTSVYGIITQVASVIASLATSYFNAYQPKYSSVCLKNDKTELRGITCVTLFLYKVIFIGGVVSLVLIGIPIIGVIRPNMVLDIKLVLLVCLFYYLYNQHCLAASMIASSNIIPYWKAFGISAVGCFVFAIILTSNLKMGIWGLVWSQLLVNMVYNNWRWPLWVFNELKLKYKDIYIIGYKALKSKISKGEQP